MSTLASQRAEALSLFPGGAVAGKGLMLILVPILWFGQWGRRRWWRGRWLVVVVMVESGDDFVRGLLLGVLKCL